MADIFISYAREDREWVETLAKALTGAGYTVWWDWDLLVGKRYRETIETELQTCKATVVVWSQHSIRSDFVRDEAEEGQQRNILVPLMKENVRPPAGFRQLQTADLTQWNGASDHIEFRRMMRGLSHLIGGEPGDNADEPVDAVPPAPAPPTAPATVVAPPPKPAVSAAPITAASLTPSPAAATPAATAPKSFFTAPSPAAKPVSSPVPPAASTPTPSVAKPAPVLGTSPPPPMSTPGHGAAAMPSPLAGMKIPPSTHPIWRYVAIGGVALVALIYVVAQFSSSSPKPHALADVTPTRNTTVVSPVNTTPAEGEGRNESRSGHGSDTTAPADSTPSNNATPGSSAATDLSTASSDVSSAVQRAETADKDARAQAELGLRYQKSALGGSADSSSGMATGTVKMGNGSYAGQIYSGQAQGLGAFTYTNGDLYAGQFDEGNISGQGVVTFADKTSGFGYSGQWASGNYNGFGVYYLAGGGRLEGSWKNGKLNGFGAKIDTNGKIVEQGTYEDGTLKS